MTWLPRILKFVYYITITSAFCANMIVVSHTTTLSVFGAGLALRGPDGSMMTATDGLYEERTAVFKTFGIGLGCTVGSVVTCVWLILHWESALVCMIITLITCRTIFRNYSRITERFSFDESETVDFYDIMEGPAAIRAAPWRPMEKRVPKAYIKASSVDEDDIELQQESKHINGSKEIKRRGKSSRTPSSGERESNYITTI
jgi:hypothetical protein